MIELSRECPVVSKDRQAERFAPYLVTVPILGARPVQVCPANPKRIELWIFNNWPNYGVFVGPQAMNIPAAASGVPSDLASAGGSVGWPLGGYEKVIITTLRGELWVASNLAAGSAAALLVVDVSE